MNREAGFSLIELMVGLVVAALLVTVAVPSYQNFLQNNRISTQTIQLLGALHLARSEAVRRMGEVVVCRSSDGKSCDSAATTGWDDGWILFRNDDEDKPPAVDAGEEIIRVFPALDGSTTIGVTNPDTGVTLSALAFEPSGDAERAARFVLCDGRGTSSARAVMVERTGRARILQTDVDGSPLTCP